MLKNKYGPSIEIAKEVFIAFGLAFNKLKIFGEQHPRYEESIQNITLLLKKFGRISNLLKKCIFVINGSQVEYCRIPLLKLGEHGEKYLQILKDLGFSGFSIHTAIGGSNLNEMMKTIRDYKKFEIGESGHGRVGSWKEDYFFFSKNDLAQATPQQNENIIEEYAPEEILAIPEFDVSDKAYDSIIRSCRSMSLHQDSGLSLSYDKIERTSDEVVKLLDSNNNPRSNIFSKRYFDEYNFHHSINVCMIVTTVASNVLKDQEQLKRISIAALMHDIGKNNVPADILYKPGRLSEDEFQFIKNHPIYGAEILLGVDGIDPLCVATCYGHHMYQGERSYPITRKPYPTDWVTKLISVVDTYEALTAYRPYKKGITPETAFKILFDMPGLRDRIEMIKLLYDCLGPYPEGSYVELNSGERGVVIQKNLSKSHSPIIRLLTDKDRNLLKDTRDLDLSKIGPLKILKTLIPSGPTSDILADETEEEPTEILGRPITDDRVLMDREC